MCKITFKEIEEARRLMAGYVIDCGNCTDCCGIVTICNVELEKIGKPHTLDGLDCCFLKDGKCSCYDERPLICRLFGIAKELKCPKKKPKKWLAGKDVKKVRKIILRGELPK